MKKSGQVRGGPAHIRVTPYRIAVQRCLAQPLTALASLPLLSVLFQDRARCQQLSADLASRDRQIEALRSTIQQVDVQKQNLEATIASKEQLLNARLAQIEQLSAANTQLQSQLDGMQVHVQRSRDSADINVLRAQLEQVSEGTAACRV